MSVLAPYALPQGSASWTVYDWRPVRMHTPPAAGGVAQLVLDTLAADELWLIDHAVTSCSSTSTTVLRYYENSVDPGSLLDGTDVGNFGVADWPAGLVVFPSTSLVLRWTGASDGAIGTLNAQVRILRRA